MHRYTSLLWDPETKRVFGKNAVSFLIMIVSCAFVVVASIYLIEVSWTSIFLGTLVVLFGIFVIIYSLKQAKKEHQEQTKNEPAPFFHQTPTTNTKTTTKTSAKVSLKLKNADKNIRRRRRHLEHIQMELPLKKNNANEDEANNVVNVVNSLPKPKRTPETNELNNNHLKSTGAVPKVRKPTYLKYETEEEVDADEYYNEQKFSEKIPKRNKAKRFFKKISNETKGLFRTEKSGSSDKKRLINSPVLPRRFQPKNATCMPLITRKSGFKKFFNKVLNTPSKSDRDWIRMPRRKSVKIDNLDVIFEVQEVEVEGGVVNPTKHVREDEGQFRIM